MVDEVDDYLLSHGIPFLRYIDDQVMFANSESECQKYVVLLAKRLHEFQGLSLNMAKTRVSDSNTIIDRFISYKAKSQQLREGIIDVVLEGDPYRKMRPDDMDESQLKYLNTKAPLILESALNGDLVGFRSVKFVLKVLTALKLPELVGVILTNLERLPLYLKPLLIFLTCSTKLTI